MVVCIEFTFSKIIPHKKCLNSYPHYVAAAFLAVATASKGYVEFSFPSCCIDLFVHNYTFLLFFQTFWQDLL